MDLTLIQCVRNMIDSTWSKCLSVCQWVSRWVQWVRSKIRSAQKLVSTKHNLNSSVTYCQNTREYKQTYKYTFPRGIFSIGADEPTLSQGHQLASKGGCVNTRPNFLFSSTIYEGQLLSEPPDRVATKTWSPVNLQDVRVRGRSNEGFGRTVIYVQGNRTRNFGSNISPLGQKQVNETNQSPLCIWKRAIQVTQFTCVLSLQMLSQLMLIQVYWEDEKENVTPIRPVPTRIRSSLRSTDHIVSFDKEGSPHLMSDDSE